MAVKICKVCGKEFNGIANSKYCSNKCRFGNNSNNDDKSNVVNITTLRKVKYKQARKKMTVLNNLILYVGVVQMHLIVAVVGQEASLLFKAGKLKYTK